MLFKFAFRRNLIYPGQLILYHFLRQVVVDYIAYKFNFVNSLAYTPIVFTAEFLGGLTFYLLQLLSLRRKKAKKNHYFMSIKLIQDKGKKALAPADNYFKIAFLIFVTGYIDLAQFLYWAINIPKFQNISPTLTSRLIGLSTIAVALYYIYVLKLSIYEHHKFSLILMGICVAITFITEFFFQKTDIFLSYVDFFYALILIISKHIFAPIIDLLEKYLFEYDHMNPFLVLMYEGLVGVLISFLLYFTPDYLEDIIKVLKKNSGWDLFLFIFLIILYVILSGLRNGFKMVTTKLYSPITRNLSDNVLTPLYLIYFFIKGSDFQYEGNRNYLYFVINLILSLIISFCSCVYSELIVLFICGLEKNTHDQISRRALMVGFGAIYDVNKIDEESEGTGNYSSLYDYDSNSKKSQYNI